MAGEEIDHKDALVLVGVQELGESDPGVEQLFLCRIDDDELFRLKSIVCAVRVVESSQIIENSI